MRPTDKFFSGRWVWKLLKVVLYAVAVIVLTMRVVSGPPEVGASEGYDVFVALIAVFLAYKLVQFLRKKEKQTKDQYRAFRR